MMTIEDANNSATDGALPEMIKARLTVQSQHRAAAMLEIALLALAEAARLTEDETVEQDAIDAAAAAVGVAIRVGDAS